MMDFAHKSGDETRTIRFAGTEAVGRLAVPFGSDFWVSKGYLLVLGSGANKQVGVCG